MAGKEIVGHSEAVQERKDPKRSVKSRAGLQKLLDDNGSTRVISQTNILNTFGTSERLLFDPEAFQSVHTVRVRTASGEIKELIRDGHHRAKGVSLLWDDIEAKFGIGDKPGQFQFTTYDVTDIALNKFYDDDTKERPQELTMSQYWNDVIAPTRQHSELEGKRTLGHIIMGWEDEIGAELASEYTAFAAIALVTSPKVQRMRWKNPEAIPEYFTTMFADEPQKDVLSKAMMETYGVIDNLTTATHGSTNVTFEKIRTEAVLLMGPDAEYIGGPEVAKREIAGLANLPEIRTKVGNYGKHNLQHQLEKFFERDGRQLPSHFDSVYTAFADPDFTLQEATTIINAKNPRSKFSDIEKNVEQRQKIQAYEEKYHRPATEFEKKLLKKRGRGTLDEHTINTIGTTVLEAIRVRRTSTDPMTVAALGAQQKALETAAERGSDYYRILTLLQGSLKRVSQGERIIYETPKPAERMLPARAPAARPASPPLDSPDRHRQHLITLMERIQKEAERADNAEQERDTALSRVSELENRLAAQAPDTSLPAAVVESEDDQRRRLVEEERHTKLNEELMLRATLVADYIASLRAKETASTEDPDPSETEQSKLIEIALARATRAESDVAGRDARIRTLTEELTQLRREKTASDTRISVIEKLLTTAEAKIGDKDAEIARLTDLLAELTANQLPTTAQVETQGTPPSPGKETVVFDVPAPKEFDPAEVAQLDTIAKTILSKHISPSKWEQLHKRIKYKEFQGIDAIGYSLAEPLGILMQETNWRLDNPRIQVLIATHYMGLLRAATLSPGEEIPLSDSIREYKKDHNLPHEIMYNQILQILLYSDPINDSEIRNTCKQLAGQRPTTFNTDEAKKPIRTFLKKYNFANYPHFIRDVFAPVQTKPSPAGQTSQ